MMALSLNRIPLDSMRVQHCPSEYSFFSVTIEQR